VFVDEIYKFAKLINQMQLPNMDEIEYMMMESPIKT
jgi:hypothetical protein